MAAPVGGITLRELAKGKEKYAFEIMELAREISEE